MITVHVEQGFLSHDREFDDDEIDEVKELVNRIDECTIYYVSEDYDLDMIVTIDELENTIESMDGLTDDDMTIIRFYMDEFSSDFDTALDHINDYEYVGGGSIHEYVMDSVNGGSYGEYDKSFDAYIDWDSFVDDHSDDLIESSYGIFRSC